MEEIRNLAQSIWDALGPGYSESVYHCAFEVALRSEGIPYETERIVPVFFQGQNVGHVRADLILRNTVVLELKSVGKLTDAYRIQTRNYLKLLGLETGCLINFPDRNSQLEFEVITLSSKTPTEVLDISSPKFDPECTTSPLT